MSSRKKYLFWAFLFVAALLLLIFLGTGFNVFLIQDYYKSLELSKTFPSFRSQTPPWIWIIFGSLAFLFTLGAIILFFTRLLQEMRLNQLQSEFLAALTHELKTPIAALELNSSLIRSGDLTPEETEKLWAGHTKELKRLKNEVETLLEAARWQAGFKPPQYVEPVQLERWIQSSWSFWKELLGPLATLEREGPPLFFEIKTDLKLLRLIFDNLMDNARKYAVGPPRVKIISTLSAERQWTIKIVDAGMGFSPQDSKKIFHRFFRVKAEKSHHIPGTGLGLYIAKNAADRLSLTLSGQSDGVGKGATFLIEPKRSFRLG